MNILAGLDPVLLLITLYQSANNFSPQSMISFDVQGKFLPPELYVLGFY